MDALYPSVNAATLEVLNRLGLKAQAPGGQVCCGALNTHVGDLDTARDLARRNIDAFLASDVDAIVVASAGCGIRMKEYGHLLRHDPQYAERAHRFDQMVKDVHEFLAELPFEPPMGSDVQTAAVSALIRDLMPWWKSASWSGNGPTMIFFVTSPNTKFSCRTSILPIRRR